MGIVHGLAVGDARVVDLVAECQLAQSTVSARLRICRIRISPPSGRGPGGRPGRVGAA